MPIATLMTIRSLKNYFFEKFQHFLLLGRLGPPSTRPRPPRGWDRPSRPISARLRPKPIGSGAKTLRRWRKVRGGMLPGSRERAGCVARPQGAPEAPASPPGPTVSVLDPLIGDTTVVSILSISTESQYIYIYIYTSAPLYGKLEFEWLVLVLQIWLYCSNSV